MKLRKSLLLLGFAILALKFVLLIGTLETIPVSKVFAQGSGGPGGGGAGGPGSPGGGGGAGGGGASCGASGQPCCTTGSPCDTSSLTCFGGTCTTFSGGSVSNIQVKNGPPLTSCGIQTAIGCIPIESQQALAGFFLSWGMGLGGGIALIMIVISTFMIMTSAGDPKKLMAGKELMTSAISGLILLVFSAYILNLIGVDILGIF